MEEIIRLSIAKSKYLRHIIEQYNEIGFKEFDMVDLAQFSIRDWQNKKYPIPKGYIRNRKMFSNKLVKITKEELLKSRILKK